MKNKKTFTPYMILKYIGRKYFKTVFLTSLVLSSVWLLAESVELARRLASKNVEDFFLLKMLFYKSSGVYFEILPFAILIGTLICFSNLARNNELVVIRAGGISVWQFLTPPIIISFIIGIFGVVILNPVAASMQKKHDRLEAFIDSTKATGSITNGKELWLKYSQGDRTFILHSGEVRKEGAELKDISVYVYNQNNNFLKRIDSEKASLVRRDNNLFWLLENAIQLVPTQRKQILDEVLVPTQMTPEKIQYSFASPKTISIFDLVSFIESLNSAGFSTLKYKVMMLSILCLPLLCIAMFILAAPFALHFSRRGGLGKLLIAGLCFGFVFYIFNNIIITLAQAGRLNMYIAVVIPIVIASLLGVYMLLHFREE